MEKYDRGKIAYWLASFIGIGGITQLLIFPNQNWFFWIAIILSLLILILKISEGGEAKKMRLKHIFLLF